MAVGRDDNADTVESLAMVLSFRPTWKPPITGPPARRRSPEPRCRPARHRSPGTAAAKWRRIRQQTDKPVLIAMTGYGQRKTASTQDAGFDYHLVKPVIREAAKLSRSVVSVASYLRSVHAAKRILNPVMSVTVLPDQRRHIVLTLLHVRDPDVVAFADFLIEASYPDDCCVLVQPYVVSFTRPLTVTSFFSAKIVRTVPLAS